MKMSQSNSKKVQKMKRREKEKQFMMGLNEILKDPYIHDFTAIEKCYFELLKRNFDLESLKKMGDGIYVRDWKGKREFCFSEQIGTTTFFSWENIADFVNYEMSEGETV